MSSSSSALRASRVASSAVAPSADASSADASSAVASSAVTSAAASSGAGTGFADLGLPQRLVDALASTGVTTPFPIQAATLPHALAGRDLLGRGRTGSGKTLAFVLPFVAQLGRTRARCRPGRPRGLILAPTRELATQIDAVLAPLAATMSLRTQTVFGGVPASRQIRALQKGVDIVVACPGRLMDLIESGHADLGDVEITVLDEADHMADLGFLPVVRRLMDQTPADGQRMLFSATLDGGVNVLVKRYLDDPAVHSVDSANTPVATMEHHVLHVDGAARLAVITELAAAPGRTVVFTRTKHRAKALTRQLNASGVRAVELHGNLSQAARSKNLASFASGTAGTLVATDIAARGIHVDDVALVIHADPPVEHKSYVHRSGRTARAGANGTVVTIMLDEQVREVRDLVRRAGVQATTTRVAVGHPLLMEIAPGVRTFVAPEHRRPASTASALPTRQRAGRNGARRSAPGRSRTTSARVDGAPTRARRPR